MAQPIQPSIRETAFCCPHCSAFTTQYWYGLLANSLTGDKPIPFIPTPQDRKMIEDAPSTEVKESALVYFDKILTGLVFFSNKGAYGEHQVRNLHLSKCYNCKKIAVWVHDRLLFPVIKSGVVPSPDLPYDIIRDLRRLGLTSRCDFRKTPATAT